MKANNEIVIIGGGISGITSALLLQATGYRTRLVTVYRADEAEVSMPEFASMYPAASAIPHSVTVQQLPWHVNVAVKFFQLLADHGAPGVRSQPHFEVAEMPLPVPDYAPLMPGFKKLPADGSGHPDAPLREGATNIYGWHFRTYFAEMPRYLPWLFRTYESLGGRIQVDRVEAEDFATLGGEAIINCTGRWAVELVEDPAPFEIIRGHVVKLSPPDGSVDLAAFSPLSYNYIPNRDVYARQDGSPADVYFYPRSDAWLLGGTRQKDRPKIGGPWGGSDVPEPAVTINGIRLPQAMLKLNFQLIRQVMRVDPSGWHATADVGYRFARDLQGEGLRLEATEEEGVPMVHNYGHGGAGVAFSWSCALGVQQLLQARFDITSATVPQNPLADELAELARNQPSLGERQQST